MKEENIRELQSLEGLKLISQGNTAEVFQFDEKKILKLFREGMPKEAIYTEYEKVCLIQNQVTNMPKAFEMVYFQGRYGIIYEKITGIDMIQKMLHHPLKLKFFSKELAHYHAAIHKNDIDVTRCTKDKLANEIELEDFLTSEEKGKLLTILSKLPEGKTLCHMDFHPGNVMLQGDKPIVIDWMTACTGCAAADVARTCLLMKYGEIAYGSWMTRKTLGILEKYIGRIYRKEYQKITGMSNKEIDQWISPLAAGRLVEWVTDSEKDKLVKLIKRELRNR